MGDGCGRRPAGAWAWREAVAGAVIIVAANGFLYPLAARMDRLHFEAGRELTPVDYVLELVCQRDAEPAVRAKLVEAITGPGFRLKSLARRHADAPDEVVLNADVAATERKDAQLESAVRALSTEPVVRAVRWSTKNEAAADWIGAIRLGPRAVGHALATFCGNCLGVVTALACYHRAYSLVTGCRNARPEGGVGRFGTS